MREILFRGKREDNSQWVMGFLSKTRGLDNKLHICIDYEEKGLMCSSIVIPETIGQYTGITDDNGKKIFEGDILGITNDDPDYDYITKVYLDCNTLCVDVQGQDYDYTSIGFAVEIWDDECDQLEVIGNIHDNPELLKGVKNVQL